MRRLIVAAGCVVALALSVPTAGAATPLTVLGGGPTRVQELRHENTITRVVNVRVLTLGERGTVQIDGDPYRLDCVMTLVRGGITYVMAAGANGGGYKRVVFGMSEGGPGAPPWATALYGPPGMVNGNELCGTFVVPADFTPSIGGEFRVPANQFHVLGG